MAPSNKKTIEIEKLLRWAYREELLKSSVAVSRGAWDSILRMGELGTRIDDQVGPSLPEIFGAPHPDAKIIDDHVRALPDVDLDWQASRAHLLGPLVGLLTPADDAAEFIPNPIRVRAVVMMAARMGRAPDYQPEPPSPLPIFARDRAGRAIFERTRGGNPLVQFQDQHGRMVEGHCKARHYGRNARCPLHYEPAVGYIAFRRAEYAAWHAALVELSESLHGKMTDFEPAPPAALPAPWCDHGAPAGRLLPAKADISGFFDTLKTLRPPRRAQVRKRA